MNIGWIGDKGQGKSYLMAKNLHRILRRNKLWHEKYDLPLRHVAVMSTLGLAEWYKQEWNEYLIFFDKLEQLSLLRECDVFVDDISMRLDARKWELLTNDVREWLYGSERLGCDLYFTAQKFSRVEITFRLLTDAVYLVSKNWGSPRPSATRPQVKRIWGILSEASIPKDIYQNEKFNQDDYAGGGKLHLIRKKYIEMYDHTNVSLSKEYPALTPIMRWCYTPECPDFQKHGGPHLKVTHV